MTCRPLIADLVEQIMSDAERKARANAELKIVHQRAKEREQHPDLHPHQEKPHA